MKKLYLDLDGVFANFDKAVKSLTGFKYADNPALAWSFIDKVDNFFLTLEPLPEAIKLFKEINNRIVVPVTMLTALPMITNKLDTAANDKRTWIAKYLSPEINVICANSWAEKKKYCKYNDVLVDDSARNIADWVRSGGEGILHFNNDIDYTLIMLKALKVIK